MNKTPSLACIVLAAGRGTRMKSNLPKVMHPVAGMPILKHILRELALLNPARIVVVRAPDMDELVDVSKPYETAIQMEPKGTGDAARAGMDALGDFNGQVMVLYGDMPLLSADYLRPLQTAAMNSKLALLAAQTDTPERYGRVLLDAKGFVEKIVEYKDATDAERSINLVNAGGYLADAADLRGWLQNLTPNNVQGEYYLTDIVQPNKTAPVLVPFQSMLGANTRAELAAVERVFQDRKRAAAMDAGVTLVAPETVFFSADTELSSDVTIEPNVIFGAGVRVGAGATIRAFCHLEGCSIDEGASVGPFARIRPGTKIGKKAKVGNFIEIKNTTLADGVKAGHVGYLGDATIGTKTNIGAGTIIANYDGVNKFRTEIGAGVMVGVHTSLVAPVTVGDGAYIGAGTTVTKHVAADALVLSRTEQKQIEGWAKKNRDEKEKGKH